VNNTRSHEERDLGKRLKDALSFLPADALASICNSYDMIGDIAIIRLTKQSERFKEKIARAIMQFHGNVRTVLAQMSAIQGDFRLRKLEYVGGEDKTRTIHTESGCWFSVDVASCYFSPRLIHERMRIANQVRDEVAVNMFAGVGCFSIIAAKHSIVKKIYSIDINPIAIQFLRENVRINRVFGTVVPLLGDAKEIIGRNLNNVADRILMPLPGKAFEYLPFAFSALKKEGGLIHYYDFEYGKKAERSICKVSDRVMNWFDKIGVGAEVLCGHIVRSIGPHWFQIVLDVRVKSSSDKFNK